MPKFDFGGSLSGAATGAAAGAPFGPVGVGVGGVAGGLLGAYSRSRKRKKRSTLDQTQQGLYDQYAQGIQGQGQFANDFNFNPQQSRDVFNKNVAQPAYQNFQENIVPSITGQFRGGNLQNSSYLGGALSKAGTDVQRNLDAQLSRMMQEGQQSSIERRLGALRDILGMQTFAYERPQASPFDNLLGGFAEGAGQYAAKNLTS